MNKNIFKIQQLLRDEKYDFILITNSDLHLNENPNLINKDIHNLTGFDCSNGYLLIYTKKIIFFTDSRYLLAARKFFKKNIEVIDLQICSISKFISNSKKPLVGIVDTKLISYNMFKLLQGQLSEKNIILKPQNKFFFKKCYYPDFKYSYAFSLPSAYAPRYFQENINWVRKRLDTDGILIWSNSSIAYLLNIRSFELSNSTKPFSGLFIFKNQNKPILITNNPALTKINKIAKYFNVMKQNKFLSFISQNKIKTISCNLNEINYEIFEKLSKKILVKSSKIDIEKLKSKKTPVEVKNIKYCHNEDAIALLKFIYLIKNKKIELNSEFQISNLLYQLRKEGVNFFRNSFDYISAFDTNAAIIHYKPTKKNSKKFNHNKILLIDSGAHYLEGTTDVTRVISLDKKITKSIKNKYTLILKSIIRLENYKFKKNVTSFTIDSYVRNYLMKYNIHYGHSTGHGVGYFNDVHERYPIISNQLDQKIFHNNLFSIEPGYYLPNNYGLRIENLYFSKIYKDTCILENITKVPYEIGLIEWSMLNKKEIEHLNRFHLKIINTLQERLPIEVIDYFKNNLIYKL